MKFLHVLTCFPLSVCVYSRFKVIEALKGYGIEQIDEVFLPEDPKNEGKIKGYAFVEFSTHSDAMAAFQRLRKPDAVFGCDRSAKVAFAPSSMHPSEEILSQVLNFLCLFSLHFFYMIIRVISFSIYLLISML